MNGYLRCKYFVTKLLTGRLNIEITELKQILTFALRSAHSALTVSFWMPFVMPQEPQRVLGRT